MLGCFCAIVDPDFDDDDCTLLQHELDTTGAIELHPDANSLTYDPVPLHTRVRKNEPVTALEFRRAASERDRRLRRKASERDRLPRETWDRKQPPSPPSNLSPPSSILFSSFSQGSDELLTAMRPHIPLTTNGHGRVWKNYVMLELSAYPDFIRADPERAAWSTVWTNETMIILQFR